MKITDPFVLPDDIVLAPVTTLPEQLRTQLTWQEGDYALTRPLTRTSSKVVDAQAAELLETFRKPTTIVDAVIHFSRAHQLDPEEILNDAFPLVQSLLRDRLLLAADASEAQRIMPTFADGETFEGWKIIRCLQFLEDTEVYQLRAEDGTVAVLKILRPNGSLVAQQMFQREAAILQELDGTVSPRLLAVATRDTRPYLIMEWCPGVDAATVADELRRHSSPDQLLQLCCDIADAYAQLHRQQVLHSDIHPRNILVADNGKIKLIDYGFARMMNPNHAYHQTERAGIGFFFEPEYAQALLVQERVPLSTPLGEQYALAALLYLLLAGTHYLDFSLERETMLRQIAQDSTLAFSHHGLPVWPAVENILGRALSKNPTERFASVADFALALRKAGEPETHARAVPTKEFTDATAQALLTAVLARTDPEQPLFASGVTAAPTCSFNYGAAGIAYMLYRIALVQDNAELLAAADLWINKALAMSNSSTAFYNSEIEITEETVGHISPYHTLSGLYGVQALIRHAFCDFSAQQRAIDAFIQASSAPCSNLDLTLGRASTLLSCALLLDTMHNTPMVDSTTLRALGDTTLQAIWAEIDAFPAIQQASQFNYLGIAHGWAGLLYATLQWHRAAGHPLPEQLPMRLQQLVQLAEPIGRGVRWPWLLQQGPQASNYMSGWCNGSAGQVFLWTLAHRTYKDDAYLALATKAAWNTWEDLSPIGNLCCGLAGRTYALLNLYKYTSNQAWLSRAYELGKRTARAIKTSDMPVDSLYKGEIGVALLVAELERPELATMPLFEEEGWSH